MAREQNTYPFLRLLLLCVLGVGLVLGAQITEHRLPAQVASDCVDSDGGRNIHEPGSVTIRFSTVKDYCDDERKMLSEKECGPSGERLDFEHSCTGTCIEGRCWDDEQPVFSITSGYLTQQQPGAQVKMTIYTPAKSGGALRSGQGWSMVYELVRVARNGNVPVQQPLSGNGTGGSGGFWWLNFTMPLQAGTYDLIMKLQCRSGATCGDESSEIVDHRILKVGLEYDPTIISVTPEQNGGPDLVYRVTVGAADDGSGEGDAWPVRYRVERVENDVRTPTDISGTADRQSDDTRLISFRPPSRPGEYALTVEYGCSEGAECSDDMDGSNSRQVVTFTVEAPDPVQHPSAETVPAEHEGIFPDVASDSLIGRAASLLSQRGIIDGYPDGEFKPGQSVNRAEAAKFLLLAANRRPSPTLKSNGAFSDVTDGEWYTPYVVFAESNGIIDGYPDGMFRPSSPVNTAEFLKMLTLDFTLQTNLSYPYTDVPTDSWFARYAGIAALHTLFPERSEKRLLPQKFLTRGEVAIAIYQVLQKRRN